MTGQPDHRIPTGPPTVFRLHAVLAGLVGAQHLVFPRFWTDLGGLVIDETKTWRLIGAARAPVGAADADRRPVP